MKSTFILCLFSVLCFGQAPNVSIWEVYPDSVCPGDTIQVQYKFTKPSTPDATVNHFYLPPYTIWSGNWSLLAAQKKVLYKNNFDSVYVIKIFVPMNVVPGPYSVTAEGSTTTSETAVYVKNCACSITSNFTYTANYLDITLQSTSVGTTTETTYQWDYGFGWTSGTPTTTYSFSYPGTYTIGLHVKNKFCEDDVYLPVTVAAQPTVDVGINEYSKDKQAPVYFDLIGNRITPRTGELMIEQVGTVRRKVIRTW